MSEFLAFFERNLAKVRRFAPTTSDEDYERGLRGLGAICAGFGRSRTYHGVGGPYLTRATLEVEGDMEAYLHFFHRDDEDRWLHDHPWEEALAEILLYGYREERLDPATGQADFLYRRPGDRVPIGPTTFHRMDLLAPGKGCWTMLAVRGHRATWGFRDPVTGAVVPFDEYLASKGLAVTLSGRSRSARRGP